ncbi:MAG: precorrin-8X/cobalt-precorrin-8 methylmutase, partial [Alphaproteobacteria bacterium]
MTAMAFDYLRDPEAIYRDSFAAISGAADVGALPEEMRAVALRVAHACGDVAAIDDLRWSDGAAAAGRQALADGAPVLTDSRMVADGIIRRSLPAGNPVLCTLGLGSVRGLAARGDTTRSAAAVELWTPWLEGSVVAIGNAPTALFRLLEGLADGWPRPALIVGMPVGYVGAAEAKQALIDAGAAPFIALTGRR